MTSTRELQQLREIQQLNVRLASNEEVTATLVSENRKMAIEQSKLRSELEALRSLLDQQVHNSSAPQSIQQAASKKEEQDKTEEVEASTSSQRISTLSEKPGPAQPKKFAVSVSDKNHQKLLPILLSKLNEGDDVYEFITTGGDNHNQHSPTIIFSNGLDNHKAINDAGITGSQPFIMVSFYPSMPHVDVRFPGSAKVESDRRCCAHISFATLTGQAEFHTKQRSATANQESLKKMKQALGTVTGIPETKALGKNQEPLRIMLPNSAFEDERLNIPLKHLQEQLPNKFTLTSMEQSAVCAPVLLPVINTSRLAGDFYAAFSKAEIPQGNHVIILLFRPVTPGFKPPKAVLAEKFYCSEGSQLLSATKRLF